MSPKIDWEEYNDSPKEREQLPAGIYNVEVADAEERTSAAGNKYFNIRLKEMEGGKSLCFDILMLNGKGVRIGLAKLSRLGFVPGQDDEIVAAQLIGKRAWVEVKEDSYEGKTRLVVDINAKSSACGYWSEDEPPSVASNDGDDTDILKDVPF